MSNLVFPNLPGQDLATVRTPMWRTRIQSAVSGKEQRIAYMSYPLYSWTVQLNVLRTYASTDELAQVQGLFNQVSGQGDTFLYWDANDNAIIGELVGTGDGVRTAWQAMRTYGGFQEPVQSLVTLNVYDSGVLKTLTTHYTVGATGIITFTYVPTTGHAITIDATYQYRVRFTQDTINFTSEFLNVWKSDSISFQLVKQ